MTDGPILVVVGAAGLTEALARTVVRLAGSGESQDTAVTVVHVAKVWGTGLGIQMPALQPNATERSAAQETAARAALELRERGVAAEALVIAARDAGKALAGTARRMGAGAIVVERSRAGRLARLLRGPDPARALLDHAPCTIVAVEERTQLS